MLLLAMAFLMVIAALVAFPAAEADAQTVGARCDAKVLLVLDETTSLTNNGATWDVSLAGAVSDFLAYVDLNYDGVQVAAMAFSSPAGSGNLTGWPRVGTGYTAEAAAIDAESLFGYTAVDGQAGALAASIDAAHNPA